jgi:hypothetical protein
MAEQKKTLDGYIARLVSVISKYQFIKIHELDT